jgi:SnoaL-like domain
VTAAEELLDLLSEAVAGKDRVALASLFADGERVAFVTSEESVLLGTPRIEAFAGRYADSPVTYVFRWSHVDAIEVDELSWLLAIGTETASSPEGDVENPYRATLLAQRVDADWRIVQFHGSSPHVTGAAHHVD